MNPIKKEFVETYNEWVNSISPDGQCCPHSHFIHDAKKGLIAVPYEHACAREKAWRKYVKARENYFQAREKGTYDYRAL